MRCYTRLNSWHGAAVALLLWSVLSVAHAGGITLNKAELRQGEEGMQPAADFSISLNFVVEQALTHGVPLYFIGEFSLIRPRWYWLNKVVAHGEQTAKLSYNALTRQYRLTYGALFQNFNSLDDALRVLGHQSFAQFESSLLKPGVSHIAAVRLHLDVTQLPKPLQINALANTDWDLDSGWQPWPEPARTAKGAGSRLWDFFD